MSLLRPMAKPSLERGSVNVTLTSLYVWIKPHSNLQACALYLYMWLLTQHDPCSYEIQSAHHTKVLSVNFHDDDEDDDADAHDEEDDVDTLGKYEG